MLTVQIETWIYIKGGFHFIIGLNWGHKDDTGDSMTQNIAHRGARSIAPENTLTAAARAWEIGADLWETDISVTKDEQLILFHDHSLARTTDAALKFPEDDALIYTNYTLAQIKTLDAGSWFIETDPFEEIRKGRLEKEQLEKYRDEKVPTLEEALLFTREKQWKINLELKQPPGNFNHFPMPQRVAAMLKKLEIASEQVIVSSFRHEWLLEFQYLLPDIEVQALIGDSDTHPLEWKNYSFKTYNANSRLIDENQIRTAQSKDRKINLFTVNSLDEMKKFIHLGIDGIFTDYPQRLKKLIS